VDGNVVLADAVRAYQTALGGRLLAAYALGSLAHGGFSALVSDIDLGLILSDPAGLEDAETVQMIADREKAGGSALHERLSVFWGTPSTLRGEAHGGRFPPLDRLDLIESGRLLAGSDEARTMLPRPTAEELLVAGAEFALTYLAGSADAPAGATGLGSMRPAEEHAIREIRSPELLVAGGVRRVTKLVLFPVRFLFTAATGHVGTNEAAGARYLQDDRAPGHALVAAALAWRRGRKMNEAEAVDLLRADLIPVYLNFIDDYVERLRALGEESLASAFQTWKARLS
jgi:hypothetical protein